MKKRVIIVLGVLVVLIVILALIICFKPREIKNINLAENITMKIKRWKPYKYGCNRYYYRFIR